MRLVTSLLLLAAGVAVAGCGTGGAQAAGPQPATTTVSVGGAGSVGAEALMLTTRAGGEPHTSLVGAPADSVFGMLAAVYPALGIEVAQVDRKTRTLGNVSFQRTNRLGRMPLSRVVRCGTTGLGTSNADTYRVALTVVSTVVARGTTSVIETRVGGSATPTGFSAAVQCNSTGELERAIARAVQLRAAGVR